MLRLSFIVAYTGIFSLQGYAARVSLELESSASPPGSMRLDIIWTMNATDTPLYDIDSFSFRFNVLYPPENTGLLRVQDVEVLPGWTTQATSGIGEPFSEFFFFGGDDVSGQGVSGNGTEFGTVIGSVILQAEGEVAGTHITFRHNNPQDPLPAAYDGPQNWQLRWQEEVNGPFQFDIGAGNPGDAGPNWPYHGYEGAAPILVPPEPASFALLLLGALGLQRFRR